LDYLRLAYLAAADLSSDPSTQNGAVIVRDGRVLCRAANQFPAGVAALPERWHRPLKYAFVEHAERNVIYVAAREGIATAGATLFCPWYACTDCARAIIQSGIAEVVGHQLLVDLTYDRWRDTIGVALAMLREAGVRTRHVTGAVGGVRIRFDGREIDP
jgi:dCMP deaminase